MSGSLRILLRPRWIALHLFAIVMVVAMALLGRWQMIVSDDKHFNARNFGYALQWWVFSAFALWFWWRLVRDAVRPRSPQPETKAADEPVVAYRRYVPPSTQTVADDPELAAYNEYLARIAHHTTQRDAE